MHTGVLKQSSTCESGVRKLLFTIEKAAQTNSAITDSEAQLGQLLVHSGLLSETALVACLTYANKLEITAVVTPKYRFLDGD